MRVRRSKSGRDYTTHDFYCLNCGRRAIPIARHTGHMHGKFHYKRLYCPWCRNTVNHIEIRTGEELKEFQEKYTAGEYKEEAERSIKECEESKVVWPV